MELSNAGVHDSYNSTRVSLQEKEVLVKEVLEKDLDVYLKVTFREGIM